VSIFNKGLVRIVNGLYWRSASGIAVMNLNEFEELCQPNHLNLGNGGSEMEKPERKYAFNGKWFRHDGSEMPEELSFRKFVEARMKNGLIYEMSPQYIHWWDVEAYRVPLQPFFDHIPVEPALVKTLGGYFEDELSPEDKGDYFKRAENAAYLRFRNSPRGREALAKIGKSDATPFKPMSEDEMNDIAAAALREHDRVWPRKI